MAEPGSPDEVCHCGYKRALHNQDSLSCPQMSDTLTFRRSATFNAQTLSEIAEVARKLKEDAKSVKTAKTKKRRNELARGKKESEW